jgi:hypothetical protein
MTHDGFKNISREKNEIISRYPHFKEEIEDLFQLMITEIEDGASETNEIELFRNSVNDLIEE